MSEAKGPYSKNNYVGSPPDTYRIFSDRVAVIANLAHAEGRASRDGLRETLVSISRNTCCEPCQEAKKWALKALEADGEAK